MKFNIDTALATVSVEDDSGTIETFPLFSARGFELLSRLWVKVGWDQKYSYGFTWLGRPIIQLPEDMVRIQETIYRVRPDVIIETGVAHGGSLIFYASVLHAMGHGRVIGVDIDIRPTNREAIERHELARYITLFQGSSTAAETFERVRGAIDARERALVILDSNHSKQHVADELALYAPLVAVDSYIVATDGLMEDLHDVPRGRPEWRLDNPCTAVREFALRHPQFTLEAPPFLFGEALTRQQVTHWPDAYLRRTHA